MISNERYVSALQTIPSKLPPDEKEQKKEWKKNPILNLIVANDWCDDISFHMDSKTLIGSEVHT